LERVETLSAHAITADWGKMDDKNFRCNAKSGAMADGSARAIFFEWILAETLENCC
jgi:hypothetical protein